MPPFNLAEITAEVNKQFGEGAIASAAALKHREYRGSGSIALDVALGGGYGKGTIVDVFGRESAGKTLLWEMAAVTAQKVESLPSCIYDFEGTFEPKRFVSLGGDLDGLQIVRAENFSDSIEGMFLEWCSDMLKILLRKSYFATICMDSTGAMTTYAEYAIKERKGEAGNTVAMTARAMASMLRQVVGSGLMARSSATLFFVSQMRDNIHGQTFKGRPPADKRTGGRALPFFAATQLEVSRGDRFKADVQQDSGYVEKDVEVGHETKVRVRKNKNNAKQGRVATFDLYSEGEVIGIDRVQELAKLAALTGVITKKASYYYRDGIQIAHGEDALVEYLRSAAPALRAVIEEMTYKALDSSMSAQALPAEVIYGDEDDGFKVPSADDDDEELMARLDALEGDVIEGEATVVQG